MADYRSGYGKKPWWFWILVYVIIGGLIYYGFYYFGYRNKGSYTIPQNQSQSPAY